MAGERGFFRRPSNPERGNFILPERGGIRLNAIARPPERNTTPTIPRPIEPPPPPPVKKQTTPQPLGDAMIRAFEKTLEPKTPNKNRRLRLIVGSAIAAGLAIGVGVWGTNKIRGDDEPTPQTRSVDTLPGLNDSEGPKLVDLPLQKPETKKVNPDEVFDNTARSGDIKSIKRLPQEKIENLDSFAKIDDNNTVLAIYPIDVSTSNKPDAKIKFKKANNSSGNDQDRINRAEGGYLNIFDFENVPAGSTILAPVDGTLTLFYSYPKKLRELYPNLIDEVHNISTAAINFQSGDGKKFRLIIGGGRSGGGMNPKPEHFIGLKSLTDAPIIKGEMSPSEVLEITKQTSIPVKKGQPILQLPDREFEISFSIRSEDSDPSKEKEEIINGEKMLIVQEYPTNAGLFLSEDGVIVQPQLPTN